MLKIKFDLKQNKFMGKITDNERKETWCLATKPFASCS